MFALAMDPEDFPKLTRMAHMFALLEILDTTMEEADPLLLKQMIDYMNTISAPDVTTEAELRKRLMHWLEMYLKIFAPKGVDTPH